jgi:long-chain acyl-CoA synthetase
MIVDLLRGIGSPYKSTRSGQEKVRHTMLHLGALLDVACARSPARPALRGDGGELSYGDLDRRAGAIAAGLRAGGIRRDEPVCVRVSNHSGDLAAFLGVWRAGGVVVPLHRNALPAAVEDLLARTGASFVLDGDAADPIARLAQSGPPERAILAGAALVIFTSGTSGKPKGVVLGHEAFAGKLAAIDSLLPFTPDTRSLLVLQLGFSFGQWVALLTLARGGTLVLLEKFAPVRALALLAQERIDRLGVIPTMLRAMLPLLRGAEGPAILAALGIDGVRRLFMAGGEPLPYPLGHAFRATVPRLDLCDIYGLTETSTSDLVLLPAEQDRFPGTIGRPSPGVRFAIHDQHGAVLPPGVAGELVIDTPFIMRGYLDAPDLTAASFRDRWFRTGDLAEASADGVVRLVGRSKELINRAGNKISPIEVERAFLAHPAIGEALATGVPDERLGEAIHLLVVPLPGTDPSAAELRAWAAGRLETFKIPDAVHIGQAIPTGATGKADRAQLKAALAIPKKPSL